MNKFLILALIAGLSSAATLDSLDNEVTEAYNWNKIIFLSQKTVVII